MLPTEIIHHIFTFADGYAREQLKVVSTWTSVWKFARRGGMREVSEIRLASWGHEKRDIKILYELAETGNWDIARCAMRLHSHTLSPCRRMAAILCGGVSLYLVEFLAKLDPAEECRKFIAKKFSGDPHTWLSTIPDNCDVEGEKSSGRECVLWALQHGASKLDAIHIANDFKRMDLVEYMLKMGWAMSDLNICFEWLCKHGNDSLLITLHKMGMRHPQLYHAAECANAHDFLRYLNHPTTEPCRSVDDVLRQYNNFGCRYKYRCVEEIDNPDNSRTVDGVSYIDYIASKMII